MAGLCVDFCFAGRVSDVHPAFQSLIPAVLVKEDDYTQGLSLSRLAYDLESLVSPVLAAALLTVVSYNLLFLGTVAGFIASALLVISTVLPRTIPADRTQRLIDRITLGSRVMAASPVLRGLLALNMVVAAATALVVVNTVVYVRDLLAGSITGVALALGCFGAGSMAVALVMPRLLASLPDRRVMMIGSATVVAGLAVTTPLLAIAPPTTMGWVVLGGVWIVLGAGTSLINTPSARLLRAYSDEQNRPAVFTAQFSLSHSCFILTYPLAGWVGAQIGQISASLALTVLATLAALVAARLWPARDSRWCLQEGRRDEAGGQNLQCVALANDTRVHCGDHQHRRQGHRSHSQQPQVTASSTTHLCQA